MARDLNDGESEKVNARFNSFKSYEYTNEDVHKVFNNEEKINRKAQKSILGKYAEYIHLFFSMLKDSFSGKYKELPKGSIAAMICTLLYIFSPIDIIPDIIPVIGLLDDAAVIVLCISFVAKDIEKYKKWKENQKILKSEYSEEK